MAREERLVETLVTLADTLVDDYDVIDFLQTLSERCVELLEVSAAGILLADEDGGLRHAACSSEQMRLVELLELQVAEGPCFDAYSQRTAVRCDTSDELVARWSRFGPHARESGFRAVSAVPLRLRSETIGSLNLFSFAEPALTDADLAVAQAMADIATIGILHERAVRDSRNVSAQLQGALNSRVLIEQAKGIVAEHSHINVDEAYVRIRAYARSHNRRLALTAADLVEQKLRPDVLIVASPSKH